MSITRFAPTKKQLEAALARMPEPAQPAPQPVPIAPGETGGAALETFERYVWQSLRTGATTGVAELPYTYAQAWEEAHRIKAADLDARIHARNQDTTP